MEQENKPTDKEAILKRAFERHKKEVRPDEYWCEFKTCQEDGTADMVYEAMDEYAASLLKERDELKERLKFWQKKGFPFITREHLDQNKKPLPKSIVVWMTKEIN